MTIISRVSKPDMRAARKVLLIDFSGIFRVEGRMDTSACGLIGDFGYDVVGISSPQCAPQRLSCGWRTLIVIGRIYRWLPIGPKKWSTRIVPTPKNSATISQSHGSARR